jgi:hypothetical protein
LTAHLSKYIKKRNDNTKVKKKEIDNGKKNAAQKAPVSAYAFVALEECRRSADFMTGPK